MEIKDLILKKLKENGEVRSSEIVKDTGYSRAYINRFFKELYEEGILILIGKANSAKYIPADEKLIEKEIRSIQKVHKILNNLNLHEDEIFKNIKKSSGIIGDLNKNVSNILEYTFTEILNNAIEHSASKKIEIIIERKINNIIFIIRDWGVGIFNNIMVKKNLDNEMEAIQDLIKGKQTTAPKYHSGEGIFFTSKVADILTIQSSRKKLIFDNLIDDIFISDIKNIKGTKVVFSVNLNSKREIRKIFNKYTDNNYQFSKTEIDIKLYEEGINYVSRSQARRVLAGLEKFKTIMLDFKGVDTIGQAFADEVFRVWKTKYPGINVIWRNANENVLFMINRALIRE
ncbi:MAG: STAS-like domain-containing protein [Candidatus Humimicrobiaceae bacterium]